MTSLVIYCCEEKKCLHFQFLEKITYLQFFIESSQTLRFCDNSFHPLKNLKKKHEFYNISYEIAKNLKIHRKKGSLIFYAIN